MFGDAASLSKTTPARKGYMDTVCHRKFPKNIPLKLHDILLECYSSRVYFRNTHHCTYRVLGIFGAVFFKFHVYETSYHILQIGNLQNYSGLYIIDTSSHVYTCVATI